MPRPHSKVGWLAITLIVAGCAGEPTPAQPAAAPTILVEAPTPTAAPPPALPWPAGPDCRATLAAVAALPPAARGRLEPTAAPLAVSVLDGGARAARRRGRRSPAVGSAGGDRRARERALPRPGRPHAHRAGDAAAAPGARCGPLDLSARQPEHRQPGTCGAAPILARARRRGRRRGAGDRRPGPRPDRPARGRRARRHRPVPARQRGETDPRGAGGDAGQTRAGRMGALHL